MLLEEAREGRRPRFPEVVEDRATFAHAAVGRNGNEFDDGNGKGKGCTLCAKLYGSNFWKEYLEQTLDWLQEKRSAKRTRIERFTQRSRIGTRFGLGWRVV